MTEPDGSGPSVLTLYTTDTQGATVALEATRSRRYSRRFWTMFADTCLLVAGWDRPAAYHRALMACLTLMDPTQFRRISAREIAEAAGLSIISAERALAMLESDQVIMTNGKATGAKARRINNRLASMTRAETYEALPADPQPRDSRGR